MAIYKGDKEEIDNYSVRVGKNFGIEQQRPTLKGNVKERGSCLVCIQLRSTAKEARCKKRCEENHGVTAEEREKEHYGGDITATRQ